ncbi:MAG: acyltransferase family protein [Actinobacteria bacterium]|nr:acyltransferase family protein [Actinomycetota bacterium]
MNRPRMVHQPALDGIRAVSVLAVLLFHGEIAGFGGGYVGVSVFFTLSGFLITSLLIAEHDVTHRIDVSGFYVRRAKRLLPASLLCIAAIAVLSATTDLFAGVATLQRDLLGGLFQVANWVFLAGDGSYQQLFADAAGQASPIEHYWSLAIEEQFYWIWPLAFVGIARIGRTHRGRTIVVAVITAVFAALAPVIAAVWGPDAAYWSTPARAAEILLGALAAFLVAGRTLSPRWHLAGAAALATLCATFVLFPSVGGPAYRGAMPLVGVVSALLIVGLQVPGPVRSLLSLSPFAWLGRISYGVYLYHWPVFVVLDSRRIDLDTVPLFALRMAVTLVLAQASFSLFERPVRNGLLRRPRDIGLIALGTTALVAVTAVLVVPAGTGDYWGGGDTADAAAIDPVGEGTLAPLVVATPAPTTAAQTTTPSTPASATPAPTDAAPASTVAPTSTTSTLAPIPPLARPMRVVVAGDSTAEATGFGLAQWAVERPDLAQVSILAEQGCGFVRGGEFLVQEWTETDPRCDTWAETGLAEQVGGLAPDVVMLLTTSWDVLDRRWAPDEQLSPVDPVFAQRIHDDFTILTQRLLDAGAAHVVWVREPIPNVFWWSSGQAQEDPARHAVLYAAMDDIAEAYPGRVTVVDLPAWLDEQQLTTDQEARPDGVHWSPEASARIARDFLGEQLLRAALGI